MRYIRVRHRLLLTLVVLAFGGAALTYTRIFHDIVGLSWDVRGVWRPAANAVLSGTDLYAGVWDNKPPLWHILNLAAAATGRYVLVFLILLAVANFLSSLLIRTLCVRVGYPRVGTLAAILFLAAVPVMHATQINPRPFANIGVLVALLMANSRPALAGGALAAAGLLSQYSVLAAPVVVWRYYSHNMYPARQWVMRFVGAGLSLAAIAYLAVGVVWGFDAFVAGVRYTILSAERYASTTANGASVWSDPVAWTSGLLRNLRWLSGTAVLAVIGSGAALIPLTRRFVSNDENTAYKPDSDPGLTLCRQAVAIVILLSPQFFIRTGNVYFAAFLPFLSILAAFGTKVLLHGLSMHD